MTPWQRVGDIGPGGDCGGDIQATDAVSIRYHHADNPRAVVTVYFYGVDVGHPDGYLIEEQTEFIVCNDRINPGITERWADYRYHEHPGHYAGPAAVKRARELAAAHDPASIDWDGLAPWERGR